MADFSFLQEVEQAVEKKLGRKLTQDESYQLSYAVEVDWELNHLGTFVHQPSPENYAERDLTWLDGKPP